MALPEDTSEDHIPFYVKDTDLWVACGGLYSLYVRELRRQGRLSPLDWQVNRVQRRRLPVLPVVPPLM